MTHLMNTVLFCTSLLLSAPSPGQTKDSLPFCIETYRFCATYPATALPNKTSLAHGNGIVLKSSDGLTEAVIGAFPLAGAMDGKELFQQSVKGKNAIDQDAKLVSFLFGDDFYQCYFLLDRSYYYHECYLFDSYFVLVEVRVPISMPDKLKVVQSQIRLEFNVSATGERIGIMESKGH